MQNYRAKIRAIIEDPLLNDHQRQAALARCAESLLSYPDLTPSAQQAIHQKIICDLDEGSAPYRPRYVLVDFARALAQGSHYLELLPPQNLDEALHFLTILYAQIPSITGYPVYLGDIDTLLEPYASDLSDDELQKKLRLFWQKIDRLLPDAFVHANLGPHDSRVGRAILQLERQLNQVVPNLTLKVDPQATPVTLLHEAMATVFAVAKPHFVNHPMIVADVGDNYGVASCYNTLKIGGGSHTLVRLNLKEAVAAAPTDSKRFIDHTLPALVGDMLNVMSARIRYLVEQAKFFDHSFLVKEGLIDLRHFTAMFGVVGMAEAVNLLLLGQGAALRYGHCDEASTLAVAIMTKISQEVQQRSLLYCEGSDGHAVLHAQSGIDSDIDTTAGVRIALGDEPDLLEHILAVAPLHRFFTAGVSDIFHFDATATKNVGAIIDIMRGAFQVGMRDFTFNLAGSEFMRITGYIARRSDVAKVKQDGSRITSTILARGTMDHHDIDRRLMRVIASERLSFARK